MYQSREGEEGDFGSDVGISSHEGKMLTVLVSDLGLCDLNFNNRWLRVEKLAEEKDLARFFSSRGRDCRERHDVTEGIPNAPIEMGI